MLRIFHTDEAQHPTGTISRFESATTAWRVRLLRMLRVRDHATFSYPRSPRRTAPRPTSKRSRLSLVAGSAESKHAALRRQRAAATRAQSSSRSNTGISLQQRQTSPRGRLGQPGPMLDPSAQTRRSSRHTRVKPAARASISEASRSARRCQEPTPGSSRPGQTSLSGQAEHVGARAVQR